MSAPAESGHANFRCPHRRRRPARVRRGPLRRRHPAAGVDQRPRRRDRRPDRRALQRPRHQRRGPGRRCSTPDCGVRVVSWNHRGTGGSDAPADPERVGIEEFVEDGLSVMDHFGVDRAVLMGWSMGVNTMFELAVRNPERVTGLFAVAGVPGDTFATMLGPLRLPHAAARAVTVNLSRALKYAGRALTPDHHPAAGRAEGDRRAHPLGLHAPGPRPRARRRRGQGVPGHARSTGTSTSPCAPPSTPGSG